MEVLLSLVILSGEEKESETTPSPVKVDGPEENHVDGPTTLPDEESSNTNGDAEQGESDLFMKSYLL